MSERPVDLDILPTNSIWSLLLVGFDHSKHGRHHHSVRQQRHRPGRVSTVQALHVGPENDLKAQSPIHYTASAFFLWSFSFPVLFNVCRALLSWLSSLGNILFFIRQHFVFSFRSLSSYDVKLQRSRWFLHHYTELHFCIPFTILWPQVMESGCHFSGQIFPCKMDTFQFYTLNIPQKNCMYVFHCSVCEMYM